MKFESFDKIKNFEKIQEFLSLNPVDLYTIKDIIEIAGTKENELFLVLSLLFHYVKNGSLCIPLDKEFIKIELSVFDETFDVDLYCVDEIKELTSIVSTVDLVNSEPAYKPLILQRVKGKELLYFQKYYKAELSFVNSIRKILSYNNQPLLKSIDEKMGFLQKMNNLGGNRLAINQKIAIYLAMMQNFLVISGGPGTGKTYVITYIIKQFLELSIPAEDIAIAAPTGRAAQRIEESLGEKLSDIDVKGQTLHRLLRYSPSTGNFSYNRSNLLPYKVIIIDEVSMVDIVLMNALLDAVSSDCRIILVGDKDQLPSVDAGAVLSELVPKSGNGIYSEETIELFDDLSQDKSINNKMVDKYVMLDKFFRSSGNISKAAMDVNKGYYSEFIKSCKVQIDDPVLFDVTKRAKDENFYIINNDNLSTSKVKLFVVKWVIEKFFHKNNILFLIQKISEYSSFSDDDENIINLFNIINNYRILSCIKSGFYGKDIINKYVFEAIKGYIGEKTGNKHLYDKHLFSGMPVIILQNSYSMNLFNGDVGIIIRTKDNWFAVFVKDNKILSYSVDFLPFHSMAFAITVHKSQGSEYNDVLMLLPSDANELILTREIIYTALTRARDEVVLLGNDNVIQKSIESKIERISGINFSD